MKSDNIYITIYSYRRIQRIKLSFICHLHVLPYYEYQAYYENETPGTKVNIKLRWIRLFKKLRSIALNKINLGPMLIVRSGVYHDVIKAITKETVLVVSYHLKNPDNKWKHCAHRFRCSVRKMYSFMRYMAYHKLLRAKY